MASSSSKLRINIIYLSLLAFAVAIAVRMFSIQFAEADHWLAQAEQTTTAYRAVQPDRGHIYSDDGRLLATSVPEYEIRFDTNADGIKKSVWKEGIDSLCWNLHNMFGNKTPREWKLELLNAREDGQRYKLIKRKVSHEQVKQLRSFPIWREGRFKGGLIVEKSTVRVRPFGRLAARTIGYQLKDGKTVGLESAYDEDLKGITGQRLERRLAGGVWMPIDDEMGIRPESGADIHSTIDVNLQDVADAALGRILEEHNAQYGSVVVMEVATGRVKAISNLTRQEDGAYSEDYNWAIGAATEPGSTFKLPVMMVGMERGGVRLTDIVDTENGTTKFYDETMRDSHEGGYGKINMQRAFELSSNVAISKRINKAFKSDPGAFVSGLREFGLADPLGVSIPGEGTPVLWGPGDGDHWSGVSIPWLSIGYGVQITPLQTLAFYNGIANGGKLMRPLFIERVIQGGEVKREFEPVVLNEKMCSQKTLKQVHGMLEAVVDSGTATNLRTAHFKIAGKTGTAQIATNNRYRNEGEVSYQASFVGYFPASAPKYSCIVVVSAPSKHVYYGNVVAGPVFKEIADKIYANRIELQHDFELAQIDGPTTPISLSGNRADLVRVFSELGLPLGTTAESPYVSTRAGNEHVDMLARDLPSEQTNKVPNVVGMGLRDAIHILENRGLVVKADGFGMVKKQSMRAGDIYQPGSTIQLKLAL